MTKPTKKSRKKLDAAMPKNRKVFIGTLIVLGLIVVGILYFRPQAPALTLDPQEIALAQLRQDSQLEPILHFYDGFPGFAQVSISVAGEDPVSRARNFLSSYQDLYLQNDPNLSLEVLRQQGDSVIFFQTYKNLPVFAAQLTVNLVDDEVFATVGRLLTSEVERQRLEILPAITDQDAIAIARADLGLPESKLIGNPELVVFDPNFVSDAPAIAHLAWQFTLQGGQTTQILVDAHSGELLFSVPFSLNTIDLDMQDAEGEATAEDDSCFNLSDDSYVGDESDFDSSYTSDMDAVNAYAQIFKAYDFYLETFGRDSYDGDNGQLEIFIHADFDNAAWSRDCELLEFGTGWLDYDTIVHELTHGVVSETSAFVYSYQSGALDESYADVMAVIADQLDGDNNWTVAENLINGQGPVRDISAPVHINDFVFSANTQAGDWGGVHANSVIPSFAAYLIANGGGPFNLAGIGTGKTLQLYYFIMITLPANANFSMVSGDTIAVAYAFAENGTLGFTDSDACEVRNAFATIGLEQGDFDCDGALDASDNDDDNDAVMDWEDNCQQVYNPFQADKNTDGIGDVCQPDADEDGWPEGTSFNSDNCPDVYNPEQTDSNFNGVGDACEPDNTVGFNDENCPGMLDKYDWDDDCVNNSFDNCPYDSNPGQENVDTAVDNDGDVCDPDEDSDGLSNDNDNCPFTSNALQTDGDGDMAGDACDQCPATTENITAWTMGNPDLGIEPKPMQPDSDGDGTPNACDDDFWFIDIDWESAIKNIRPFEFIDVTVDGEPGAILTLPLPACSPAEGGANVVLQGLDANIFPQLVNQEGIGAGKPHFDGDLVSLHVANLRGADKYFLQFSLGLYFQPEKGETGEDNGSSFDLSFNCSESGAEPVPSATATSTPASHTLIAVPERNANCRLGPSGNLFDIVDTLFAGTQYTPLGQGPDQRWLLFNGPYYAGSCWVLVDNLELFCDQQPVSIGDLSPCILPTAPYPLLPTLTPTPTFTPEPTQRVPQCSDGRDNDNDGYIDLRDRQCRAGSDNDEAN